MIRHCVMLRLASDAPDGAIEDICTGLGDLVAQLDGCSGFIAGENRDFEGKSPGFPYGFTFDAKDAASLQAYAENPTHKALGARLVQICEGGADGILVFDLDVAL